MNELLKSFNFCVHIYTSMCMGFCAYLVYVYLAPTPLYIYIYIYIERERASGEAEAR